MNTATPPEGQPIAPVPLNERTTETLRYVRRRYDQEKAKADPSPRVLEVLAREMNRLQEGR